MIISRWSFIFLANLGKDQQLLFRIPQINGSDSLFLKNGDLNGTALEQLKDIVIEHLVIDDIPLIVFVLASI